MKPIKLIISAFGPYSDKMPEIYFDQFEEKGLFLISGDTGAGKTTIFDAICFALYGTTSGTYRDTKNLRSEYAKPNTDSFVDFYFSHQGREYHVWRQPEYERRKQRGDGLITEKQKATLYIEGAAPIEGVIQVNNAVKELLHIDDKQFKQIAMIAQGEFWDLLNAKTEQRTEILRTIFMTSGYKDIESRLKRRMDDNGAKKEHAEQSIVQYFNDVIADKNDDINSELEELQTRAYKSGSAWNLEELIDIIKAVIELDENKKNDISKKLTTAEVQLNKSKNALATAEIDNKFIEKLANLEQEQIKLQNRKEEIDELEQLLKRRKAATHDVNPTYLAWIDKDKEISSTESRITNKKSEKAEAEKGVKEAENQLVEVQKNEPELEKLKIIINNIIEEKPKYEQRDKLSVEIAKLEETKALINKEETKLKAKEEDLKNKIIELKKTITQLRDRPDELYGVQTKGRELENLSSDITDILDNQVREWKKRQKTLNTEQKKFQNAFIEYENANDKRIEAEKILDSCRAGLLAKGLSEGTRCPVCGSTHHPELAKLTDTSITEEDYEKLKVAEVDAQEAKSIANTRAEKAKTALEEYENQMRTAILDCIENSILDMKSSGEELDRLVEILENANVTVNRKIEDNTKLQNAINKDCDLLKKSEKELEEASGIKSEKLESEKEKLQTKKNSIEAEITASKATLETLKDLRFENWNKASEEKNKAEERKKYISDMLRQKEDFKAKADKKLTTIRAEIRTLEESLKTQKNDEKLLKAELDKKLASKAFEDTESMLEFVVSEKELSETEKNIIDYKHAVTTNKTQLMETKAYAKGKEVVDIEALKVTCAELDENVREIRKTDNTVSNRIANNTEKLKNIEAQREEYEQSKKEFNICDRLYKLVKGNTGNGKITLEQYIQAAGFDGIIAAANRRLLPMSDGQYELYRQEDSVGKKSNTFLDLEVLDNYTGHRRPVGNLSGGESFKASLSLALGLSDTVSTNLGGVQMDALFIDEGFGTLDKKSIDSAMDILINLSGANKLVGVISHREELIENIPQQIRVKKTKDGSQITIDSGI